MDRKEIEAAWIPAGQAARELNTTQLKVLMLIKRNVLCGREVDGAWQVSLESLTEVSRRGLAQADQRPAGSGCGGCTACS